MSASDSATPHLFAESRATARTQVRAGRTGVFRSALVYVEMAVDFLTVVAGMFAAYIAGMAQPTGMQVQYPLRGAVDASIVVGLFAVLLLHRNGAYRGSGSLLQIRETERALRVSAQSVLVFLILSLLLDLSFPTRVLLFSLVLIPVFLVLQKLAFFSIIRTLHGAGYGVDRAAVYGSGSGSKRVVSALFQSVRLGLLPVAVIEDTHAPTGSRIFELGYRGRRSVPIQWGSITPELLRSLQCNILIVALPNLSPEKRAAAVEAAEQAGVRTVFLSGFELENEQLTPSIDVDGLYLSSKVETVASGPYEFAKRAFDVIVSTFLLVLLAPVLILIALLVRLDSPGPIVFTQKRVGRNGELFNIFKFRSMYTDAPRYDFSPTVPADSRITRIGRFIRQTSLDELPQLINVILGNMSLVGPRPEMPFIVRGYSSEQRLRLVATPGVTGLWQLSADRSFPIHNNLEYDLYYIRNRGLFFDFAILVHTLFFAIRRGV
jgi:exopolysaccharide biosynthesis polyprenyl glycosylphosphotransferase